MALQRDHKKMGLLSLFGVNFTNVGGSGGGSESTRLLCC